MTSLASRISRRPALAVLALAAPVLLAACTGPRESDPSITTSERTPLTLAVEQISIENQALPPTEGNFKDRRNSEKLAEATRSFLENRLAARGTTGWARATITKATVIQKPRETKGGIGGLVTREADSDIEATVRVRVSIVDAYGIDQDYAEAEVSRKRPVLENTSVIARDAIINELVTDLLRQLDDSLTDAVRETLGSYLVF